MRWAMTRDMTTVVMKAENWVVESAGTMEISSVATMVGASDTKTVVRRVE